jgi:plasmid stability protein
MARLTITLPDELHRALKEAAARRGRTIGDLVAESLDFYGIKSTASARDLITRARESAQLTERQAVKIATAETRRARH